MYIQIHFKENSNLTPRARRQHWWQPGQSSDLQRGCGHPPGSFEIFMMIEEMWSGHPLGSFEISMITNWNSHVNRGDAAVAALQDPFFHINSR